MNDHGMQDMGTPGRKDGRRHPPSRPPAPPPEVPGPGGEPAGQTPDRQELPPGVDWRAFRLVAVDLDGTAAGPDGRVSPAGLRALQAAERAGLHPVIVTGRALPAAMGVWLRAGLSRPVIAYGGALITWPAAGRALWQRALDPAVVDRVLELAGRHGLVPFLYAAEGIATDRRGPLRDLIAHLNEVPVQVVGEPAGDAPAGAAAGEVSRVATSSGSEPGSAPAAAGSPGGATGPAAGASRRGVTCPGTPGASPGPCRGGGEEAGGSGPPGPPGRPAAGVTRPQPVAAALAGWQRGRVLKVVLAGDPAAVEAARPEVEKGLQDLPARCVATLPELIEVVRPDATKEAALAELCRVLAVSRDQVIAIGDSENDLDMIRWAGLGVAVANARPEVRAAADWVIGHHAEEAVARFLRAVLARRQAGAGEEEGPRAGGDDGRRTRSPQPGR